MIYIYVSYNVVPTFKTIQVIYFLLFNIFFTLFFYLYKLQYIMQANNIEIIY